MADTKPTNPKDAFGDLKVPLHLWPMTATALGALAFLDGACKYGRSNYRPMGARASVYVRAALSHITSWMEGEDKAADSGVHHLGHALACLGILVDAMANGNLVDDRNYPGGYLKLMEELKDEPARILKHYAGREVKHYDRRDYVQTMEAESTPEVPMQRVLVSPSQGRGNV